MKVGDLVKIKACPSEAEGFGHLKCQCFFCSGKSNRVGIILGPGPRDSWHTMFDCGTWRIDRFDIANGDVEVISESR